MVAPILSSLERSELWRMDHNFEYLCILDHLRQIDRRAAAMMVQLEADLELYNLMVARNSNFRPTDDSGADMNLQGERYRQRLTEPDGDRVTELIRTARPILFIMIHWILPMSDVIWQALGNRLRLFVVSVRHPVWQIQRVFEGHWERRTGADPRDFQPCYLRGGKMFPWYAADWDEKYHGLSRMERAIELVGSYIEGCHDFAARRSEDERRRIVHIPFERLTTDPHAYIDRLSSALGTRETELTGRVLNQLDLPRADQWADLATKRQEFDELLCAEAVSPAYVKRAHALFDAYEAQYRPTRS